MAGLAATLFTAAQRLIYREDIEQQEKSEAARRDTETLVKLGPMLTSEKQSQVAIAILLLDGLAMGKAVDSAVYTQVKALMVATVKAGTTPDATQAEQNSSAALVAFADKERMAFIRDSALARAPAESELSAAVESALPIRVYIQIGTKESSPRAEDAAMLFRKAGLLVPGIEVVGPEKVPARDSVRYCEDKVGREALRRVKGVISALGAHPPELVALAPKLCGRVRMNHFELWLARASPAA